MKWVEMFRAKTPLDPAYRWWESQVDTSLPGFRIDFLVEKTRRCWIATVIAGGGDQHKVGEYPTDRRAKEACRRKLGRIADQIKRGIRA